MQEHLKKLFKPYMVRFQTISDVKNKSTRLSKIFNEDRIVERLKKKQCSKSKNKLCANLDCQYNLLKYDYFE